jgi:hypothetical protein
LQLEQATLILWEFIREADRFFDLSQN